MPTLEHNGLVEMFRENPSLAPHFLETVFHQRVPEHASVRVADAGLDQIVPVEFRADLVTELIDAAGRVVLAVVLEVQRERKPRKQYTWAVYWSVARAERECPAVVLVVATDAEVAAWAEEKVDLGLGRASVQPLVLGPATVPVLTDPAVAASEVELSVLSAMAHGNGPEGIAVVEAAFLALGRLDPEHSAVYFQVVWTVLREPMRRALEAMAMEGQTQGKVEFPPFMQRIIDRSELKGKREMLLRVLDRLGLALTDEQRARIEACTDPALIERWVDNAFTAKTAADVLG